MTIVVFADGTNPCAITARRSRVRERLLARLRVWRLDHALAEGASPDTSAVAFLHAHALVGMRCRRGLARELRRIMGVRAFARPFDPVITIPWRRLAPHSGELEELVERLEGAEAVDARGMAKLRLLLRDGESPLNTQSGAETLAEALQEALDALAPLVAGSNARDL
jgi:hypothetical protein